MLPLTDHLTSDRSLYQSETYWLLWKATMEMHDHLAAAESQNSLTSSIFLQGTIEVGT